MALPTLVAGMLAVNAAFAQEDALPDLSTPLTLEDCLELGLDYASSIRTSSLSVQSAGLQVEDADRKSVV